MRASERRRTRDVRKFGPACQIYVAEPVGRDPNTCVSGMTAEITAEYNRWINNEGDGPVVNSELESYISAVKKPIPRLKRDFPSIPYLVDMRRCMLQLARGRLKDNCSLII